MRSKHSTTVEKRVKIFDARDLIAGDFSFDIERNLLDDSFELVITNEKFDIWSLEWIARDFRYSLLKLYEHPIVIWILKGKLKP